MTSGLAALTPPQVRAETGRGAVIVFDESGSMAGEFGPDKRVKLDVAREALRATLGRMTGESRVGLIRFGRGCSGIQIDAPPDAAPPGRIAPLLDRIRPSGRGPLVGALREAAKQLGPGGGAIILVHDGADNCGQDACAAVNEIARAAPGIAIHTVGLGLERQDAQRTACIARLSGGKTFDTPDAVAAAVAIGEAVKLANLDTGGPGGEPESAKPAAEPEPAAPVVMEGPPVLRLTASLAEGGPALKTPLRWRVLKDGGGDAPVIDKTASELSEQIPAGKYIVEAHYGFALARGPVDVADKGHTAIRVPLNAGRLKFAAKSQKTGEAVPDAFVTIWRAGETGEGETAAPAGDPIWIGRESASEIVVPAGRYLVRVDTGLAQPEQVSVVAPGEQATADFSLRLGRLELIASISEGGPPASEASFVISEDDPDSPQGRREVARSAHPEPSFTLPAGTYYVAVRVGGTEVRQRVAVNAGETAKRSLVVGLTRLEVTPILEQGSLPPNSQVLHRVLHYDGDLREIARSSDPAASFMLAAGRYRIETALGSENVKGTADTEIVPGREAKVAVRLQAGRVSVRTAEGGASGPAGAWEVRDNRGVVVWRASRGETRSGFLAPGRYVLRTESADKRQEKAFEIRTGESRTLDIGTP